MTAPSDRQVIENCREERQSLRRETKRNEWACLELLRRAVVLWTPEAFEAVNEFYGREFIAWVVRHHRYEEFCERVPYLTPEDIVQNAYVKLHRALKKRDDFHTMFPSVGYFMGYCRGAISNCLNDHLPRKSKVTPSPHPQASERPRQPRRSPDKRTRPNSTRRDDSQDPAIPDPNTLPEVIDSELHWSLTLKYANSLLTESERTVFAYKILNTPTQEQLLQAGKSLEEINKVWKRIIVILHRDIKLRQMLNN